jgi:hypothetical protein
MEQLKKEVPPVLANQAQTFFTRSFDNQGFTDGSLSKWAERKYGKDAGRNILVKSGKAKTCGIIIDQGGELEYHPSHC